MAEKVEYLTSKLIPFRHGYFTRRGGVSKKQFASLNVTTRNGDSAENVAENRSRAMSALKLKSENLAFLDDMPHGDRILAVTEAARSLDFDGYDAIMTNEANVVLGMSVADCPVVILASEKAGVVGMAHSGWRGTVANIVPKLIEAMYEVYGVEASALCAAVGPMHRVETYAFGQDARELFDARYIEERDGQLYVDLALAIEDQLVESGVRRIDDLEVNTFTDERFYSYRREQGDTGRFLVVATL